jgi:hypothetical protein
MTTFPGSPRLLKGGIVLIDSDTSKVLRLITLQYNSDTLTRTLAPKGIKESGDRSEAMRLTRAVVPTLKLGPEVNPMNQFRAPMQLTRGGNR